MKQFKVFILLLLALVFIINPITFSNEYSFEYQKIIKVTSPVVLDLNMVRGKIIVASGDDDRVIIDAVKTVRASNEEEAEEVADHIEIKVNSHKNKISVETNYLRIINRSRSFWSKLFGTGGSESFGMVDYIIKVPTQTSISINSMEANIEISSIEGEIEINNSSGSTRGEYLFGNITLSQPVGEIELLWIEGDIRIKSNSSQISIHQVRGAIDLATYSGSVNIQTELDSPKDYYIETTTGSISFTIPSSSSGILNIETETGEISTEVAVVIKSVSRKRLVGVFGDGGLTINLNSTTGDVNVTQY